MVDNWCGRSKIIEWSSFGRIIIFNKVAAETVFNRIISWK